METNFNASWLLCGSRSKFLIEIINFDRNLKFVSEEELQQLFSYYSLFAILKQFICEFNVRSYKIEFFLLYIHISLLNSDIEYIDIEWRERYFQSE